MLKTSISCIDVIFASCIKTKNSQLFAAKSVLIVREAPKTPQMRAAVNLPGQVIYDDTTNQIVGLMTA